LISVHQQKVVFLQAAFSEEYVSYLYSATCPPDPPYVTIYRSTEYDLANRDERQAAAEVVIALALLFIEQEQVLD
jgi:hypothetical protein